MTPTRYAKLLSKFNSLKAEYLKRGLSRKDKLKMDAINLIIIREENEKTNKKAM